MDHVLSALQQVFLPTMLIQASAEGDIRAKCHSDFSFGRQDRTVDSLLRHSRMVCRRGKSGKSGDTIPISTTADLNRKCNRRGTEDLLGARALAQCHGRIGTACPLRTCDK